jgi:hypothetical protein
MPWGFQMSSQRPAVRHLVQVTASQTLVPGEVYRVWFWQRRVRDCK